MTDAPLNPAESVWPATTAGGDSVTLADALVFLRRQFWLILGVVAAIVVVAAVYVVLAPSEYVARAELMIEPGKQRALWQDSGLVDLTIDNAQVESQVEVLRSERIANDVIGKLGLVNDPEFRTVGTDYERQRATLARFENALSARRVGQSYVIEVSFRSRDPAKAARITNALTDAYLADQQQAKQDVAKEASDWVENQIADLGVKLNAAAAAAQEFRVSHGITDAGGANSQPQLIDKLTLLESKAQAYRKVYESLLERFTENQQQASYPVSNARVITSATQPLGKTYPKSELVLLLSLLVGLVIGGVAAALRAMFDGSVRSPKQVRQSLGLSILGLLPTCRREADTNPATGNQIAVIDAPLSPFGEAMRYLKLSVRHACGGRSGYCLGLLSLQPDEATSTIAVNLAALFQASGTQTLLVDADLHERRLTRRLAPDSAKGLADALHGRSADVLVYEPRTRAHLLPAGGGQPNADAADPLDSAMLPALLATLKQDFGTILVDLPALCRARAAAPVLDGCILVCRYGRTSLRALEDAVDLLRADNVVLFGVVIAEMSGDIPPLFGVHLDELRGADYGELAQRVTQHARRRLSRGVLR
jgi:Mrp family chromosome partitioning ATPase/LPS O-antigen subunit length determinant protein (WzzB/FepE family)